jgi:hypothetical protein
MDRRRVETLGNAREELQVLSDWLYLCWLQWARSRTSWQEHAWKSAAGLKPKPGRSVMLMRRMEIGDKDIPIYMHCWMTSSSRNSPERLIRGYSHAETSPQSPKVVLARS